MFFMPAEVPHSDVVQAFGYRSQWLRSDDTIADQRFSAGDDRPQQPGRCLVLNGTTEVISTGVDAADTSLGNFGTADFAISGYLYDGAGGSAEEPIVTKGWQSAGDWSLYITSTDLLRFNMGGVVLVDSTTTLLANTWYHFVISRISGTTRLYLDNVDEANTAIVTSIGTSPHTIGIGKENDALGGGGGVRELGGRLFDIRLFGSGLTVPQITAEYNQGINPHKVIHGRSVDLDGAWYLDDNSTTKVIDHSGNGHDGTIVNGAAGMLYEGNDVPYSPQNLIGWSPATGFLNDVPNQLSQTQSMRFDGVPSSDGIAFDDVSGINIAGTWTMSAWVRMHKVIGPNRHSIVGVGVTGSDRNGIGIDSGGKFSATIYNGSSYVKVGDDFPVDGEWHFVCGTNDNQTLRAYIDGFEIFGTPSTMNLSGGSTNVGMQSTSLQHFEGQIADVRVYDVVKTPAQITTMATGFDDVTDLIFNPKLDGDLTDATGNEIDGILEGGTNTSLIGLQDSNPSIDAFGATASNTGQAPRDGELLQSNCGTFDGVDDIVSASISEVSYPFTIEAGVDESSFTGYFAGINGSGELDKYFALRMAAAGTIRVDRRNTTAFNTSTAIPVIAGFQMIKIVFLSATSFEIWQNGVFLETQSGLDSVSLDVGFDTFTCGSLRSLTPTSPFAGSVYNAKLTYGTTVEINLPFSEGAGSTIYDVSGNGNHGTASGITESTFWGTKQDVFHRNVKQGFDHVGRFDGVGDYVSYPITNPAYPFTLEATFVGAPSSTPVAIAEVADASEYFGMQEEGPTDFRVYRRSAAVNITTLVTVPAVSNLNSFRTYKVVYLNDTDFDVYQNDILISNETAASVLLTGDLDVCLAGARNVTPLAPFDGPISRVKYTEGVTVKVDSIIGEGSGTDIENIAGTNGTLTTADVDTFWGIRVPSLADGSSLVGRSQLSNPQVIGHNNAETQINFNTELLAPWTEANTLEIAYEFGDARTPLNYKTVNSPAEESEYRTDEA